MTMKLVELLLNGKLGLDRLSRKTIRELPSFRLDLTTDSRVQREHIAAYL